MDKILTNILNIVENVKNDTSNKTIDYFNIFLNEFKSKMLLPIIDEVITEITPIIEQKLKYRYIILVVIPCEERV